MASTPKYAITGGSGWNYFTTMRTAKRFAQRIADDLGKFISIYKVENGYATSVVATVKPSGYDRSRRVGRSNPNGNGKWIPATAVRMLPGGRVQVKVPRGAIRNPQESVFYKGHYITRSINYISSDKPLWNVLGKTFKTLSAAKKYIDKNG